MPGALLNEKRQIVKVIKRFKFEELENSVVPLFPETSWKKIRTDLIENQQRLTVMNAAKIIEKLIDDCRLSNQHLRKRISLLEVIDVSRHHMKKTWYTFEMMNMKNEINFMTRGEIEAKVMELFLEQKVNAEVHTASHDGIIFVAMKPKLNKKKPVGLNPFFFALLLGNNHFFCSKKTVANTLTTAISNTMGYSKCKKVELFGKNLLSLIQMLWQKRQGAINTVAIDVPYQDQKPLVTSTGINFTQAKHRKQYVETIFGPEPPKLETLILQCVDSTWNDEEIVEKLPDHKFCVGWNLSSTSINNLIPNLVKVKVLSLPMPNYLEQWTTSGKNFMRLRES